MSTMFPEGDKALLDNVLCLVTVMQQSVAKDVHPGDGTFCTTTQKKRHPPAVFWKREYVLPCIPSFSSIVIHRHNNMNQIIKTGLIKKGPEH